MARWHDSYSILSRFVSLIVNPILAMVAGVAALVAAVVYWNIAFDWSVYG